MKYLKDSCLKKKVKIVVLVTSILTSVNMLLRRVRMLVQIRIKDEDLDDGCSSKDQ